MDRYHLHRFSYTLITADEVAYAGIIFNNSNPSSNNYLVTGNTYWTMSPCSFSVGDKASYVFVVWLDGHLNSYYMSGFGIRPVINLRSDVTFIGDGTQSNPFKVVS